ncbi:hypothetical protein L218DRAFT_952194 [Marasmius fiardii PR-910]|nr:hypothetical protein L218DRAFT_952194 [Marasmius fiardii PR-910]
MSEMTLIKKVFTKKEGRDMCFFSLKDQSSDAWNQIHPRVWLLKNPAATTLVLHNPSSLHLQCSHHTDPTSYAYGAEIPTGKARLPRNKYTL